MLSGLWFLVCTLLIIVPTLLIVGAIVTLQWTRKTGKAPARVSLSLVAMTLALLPDFLMLVNLFTGFRIIRVIPNSDNVPLFVQWQIASGSLLALTLVLSCFERMEVKKLILQGSLIFLMIHGAGTLLFFIDSVFSWFRWMEGVSHEERTSWV
jgi:hypothetical protein